MMRRTSSPNVLGASPAARKVSGTGDAPSWLRRHGRDENKNQQCIDFAFEPYFTARAAVHTTTAQQRHQNYPTVPNRRWLKRQTSIARENKDFRQTLMKLTLAKMQRKGSAGAADNPFAWPKKRGNRPMTQAEAALMMQVKFRQMQARSAPLGTFTPSAQPTHSAASAILCFAHVFSLPAYARRPLPPPSARRRTLSRRCGRCETSSSGARNAAPSDSPTRSRS